VQLLLQPQAYRAGSIQHFPSKAKDFAEKFNVMGSHMAVLDSRPTSSLITPYSCSLWIEALGKTPRSRLVPTRGCLMSVYSKQRLGRTYHTSEITNSRNVLIIRHSQDMGQKQTLEIRSHSCTPCVGRNNNNIDFYNFPVPEWVAVCLYCGLENEYVDHSVCYQYGSCASSPPKGRRGCGHS
jgi:hypothetical protein